MKQFTDKQMEASVGGMLRIGVLLSASVVLIGGIFYLRQAPIADPDYAHFQFDPDSAHSIAGAIHAALRLDGQGIIQVGILLLIATPVTRVLLCVVGFTRQGDRPYIFISCAVLAILLYSFIRSG